MLREKVPSGQILHSVEPSSEIYPEGQGIHSSWLIEEKVPEGHFEQEPEPSKENSPSLQRMQSVLSSLE